MGAFVIFRRLLGAFVIDPYHSNATFCECSETRLLSSIYDVQIPCSHMISCGAETPACPKVSPVVENQWDRLEVSFEILPPENPGVTFSPEYYDKKMAVSHIKRCSKYHNIDEIRAFVDSEYSKIRSPIEHFLNDLPDDLITLILSGCEHFVQLKKQKKSQDE